MRRGAEEIRKACKQTKRRERRVGKEEEEGERGRWRGEGRYEKVE